MKGKNAEYQEKLDHLRFFAAFLIIIYHSVWTYYAVCHTHPLCKLNEGASVPEPPFFSLILEGHTAVALFMTLSGFLFATICKGKEIDHWGFYRNRFLRIYPMFLVVLLIACYMDSRRNDFVSLLTSLFFMQNTQSAVYLLNGTESLWAIAVEFQFYLLFPWLLLLFRRYGYKYLLGLVLLAFLTRLAVYLATGDIYQLSYTTIFGRIDQFVIGMICGFLYEGIKPKLRHPLVLASSVAGGLALVSCLHKAGWAAGVGPHWIFATDLEGVVWGLLIVAYSASSFAFPKGIARLLAFAGSLSYSLYLIHPAVLRLAYWFAPIICQPHSRFPLLARLSLQLGHQTYIAGLLFGLVIAFPVTFLISIFTYNLIEKPFLELRSTYTKGGKSKRDELEALASNTKELVGVRD
jgi:peptidoglycan/LPS O-acetylase OafA/YrhL